MQETIRKLDNGFETTDAHRCTQMSSHYLKDFWIGF
jgi:hypothetical protein